MVRIKKAGKNPGQPTRRVDEGLRDSETRYRRLFETTQDGILILDGNTGEITDVNPFLLKMLGYSHEELLGKKLWEIGSFSDIKASQFAFDELQKKKYIRYEDLPLRTRNGRRREVLGEMEKGSLFTVCLPSNSPPNKRESS